MMTKFWEPGKVKTRLAKSWLRSPDHLNRWIEKPCESLVVSEKAAYKLAADLHRCFVLRLLECLRSSGDRRELVGSPGDRSSEFKAAIDPLWSFVRQSEGDLGERMSTWFMRESTDADPPVQPGRPLHSVLIGSDCPLLDAETIADAFKRLENHDLVIGPASDGGYYLIGISNRSSLDEIQSVFDRIQWSTSEVLSQTLHAAERLKRQVSLLKMQDDIDTVDDLDRLLDRVKASREHSTFFNELIEMIKLSCEVSR